MMKTWTRILIAPCLCFVVSCVGTHKLSDPTLVLTTEAGSELGVSTEYGVVFLGRTARSGDVEITAWFGDGPSIESTVIEPITASVFTAETEIRLPSVPMIFEDPEPGAEVLIVGRRGSKKWEKHVRVQTDPRVDGILLEVPSELRNAPDQIGAGVFVCPDEDCKRKQFLGLVSGQITLTGEGGTRTYVSVVGPSELWPLVTHRRDLHKRKPWIYRDDIL